MGKFASLTSCTNNYLPYLNAQLNSFDYMGHSHDVHVLAVNVDDRYRNYIERAKKVDWAFKLYFHEKKYEDYSKYGTLRQIAQKMRWDEMVVLSKFGRYDSLLELAYYDAVVMLDVDMMIVHNFEKFFELVENTKYIIGANERFKWWLDTFILEGEEEKKYPHVPMDWMICNAPLFFSPKYNEKFMQYAIKSAGSLKNKDGVYYSDIMTMNFALWMAGVTDNVIALPAYAWTGVHLTYTDITTRIFNRAGKNWLSWCGEPVYIIHGRWDKEGCEAGWLSNQQKRYNELQLPEQTENRLKGEVNSTIKQIKEQFRFYSEECKLRVEEG